MYKRTFSLFLFYFLLGSCGGYGIFHKESGSNTGWIIYEIISLVRKETAYLNDSSGQTIKEYHLHTALLFN